MSTAPVPDPTCAKCGEVHVKCAAHRLDGKPCLGMPMLGGPVCRKHGGKAPQVQAKAKRRLALAEAMGELDRLGIPVEVEPSEAMLQMVYEAAGNVAFLRAGTIDGPLGSAVHKLYDEERERLVKWAKACRDAGVDEREVRLKEEQAELVAQGYRTLVASMQRVLLEAGLERKVIDAVWSEKVPGLVREALAVGGGE